MKKVLYLLIPLIFGSCDKEEKLTTNLTVNFTHTVDNASLIIGLGCSNGGECLPDHSCCLNGSLLPYENSASEKYNVQRLQYVISDISLHSNQDNLLLKDVHFINLEDLSTLHIDIGKLENAEYTSISFTMGLTNAKNQNNAFLNEYWHTLMIWPEIMGGGYHYMKLEGDFDTITQGYATHTGALQMMNDPMRMDYSFNTNIPITLNVDDNLGDVSININMEVNNWYRNPNIYNLSSAIMGDMSKQMQLQTNGLTDVFSASLE